MVPFTKALWDAWNALSSACPSWRKIHQTRKETDGAWHFCKKNVLYFCRDLTWKPGNEIHPHWGYIETLFSFQKPFRLKLSTMPQHPCLKRRIAPLTLGILVEGSRRVVASIKAYTDSFGCERALSARVVLIKSDLSLICLYLFYLRVWGCFVSWVPMF